MENRPTIYDVAKATSFSINTVSRALNGKPDINPDTKLLILDAAKKLRYTPNKLARGLRSNKTGVMGVIVADVSNPFFSAVVKGMGRAAKELGYSIILQDTSEDYANEEEAIQIMQTEQVDGVLITPVQTDDRSIGMLEESGIPFVLIARYFDGIDTDCVVADDIQGGYLATSHLIAAGHERIAFINGPACNSSAIERFQGYRKALVEHGLRVDDALVTYGALTTEDGCSQAREMLGDRAAARPTALFAFSDFVALGAMKAVREAKLRIPRDIAIVGYDDIDFAVCLEVPLTTIRVPKEEIGETGVRILCKKIQGEVCHARLKLPVELVVRESG